jgi:hypothetical protein
MMFRITLQQGALMSRSLSRRAPAAWPHPEGDGGCASPVKRDAITHCAIVLLFIQDAKIRCVECDDLEFHLSIRLNAVFHEFLHWPVV